MSGSGRIRKTMLWLAGGSAVAFAAVRVASWAVAALRTSLLASLGAMFASGAGVSVAARRDDNASIRSSDNRNVIAAAEAYRTAVSGDARAIAAHYQGDGVALPPQRRPR